MTETPDVLLVEDNPGDVRLTEEALDEAGTDIQLHVVNDGVEALSFLSGTDEYAGTATPDVILLDLNLPRKGGEEVLEAIQEDPSLPTPPVIVLTSSDTDEDVARSYELSANAYLTKPVAPEEFIETIRRFESFWLSTAQLPSEGG
ncbi:response regulator [Halolamina sp. CBA1230]|uniref:response regulator n=1 Tax=Halolamina sp. CBA1230 TaxID=1853690 RepID=UPI0009A25AA8|nr:response regulator [Halolamina sp. CBA1230]QKY19507.1 response regulator [Halolamina sp. CBA1230]